MVRSSSTLRVSCLSSRSPMDLDHNTGYTIRWSLHKLVNEIEDGQPEWQVAYYHLCGVFAIQILAR